MYIHIYTHIYVYIHTYIHTYIRRYSVSGTCCFERCTIQVCAVHVCVCVCARARERPPKLVNRCLMNLSKLKLECLPKLN